GPAASFGNSSATRTQAIRPSAASATNAPLSPQQAYAAPSIACMYVIGKFGAALRTPNWVAAIGFASPMIVRMIVNSTANAADWKTFSPRTATANVVGVRPAVVRLNVKSAPIVP